MSGKVKVGLVVAPQVDRAVEIAAARVDASKSQIYELGARLVLAIIQLGHVPDDCAALESVDREALEELAQLARLARLAKSLAEEPSYEVV